MRRTGHMPGDSVGNCGHSSATLRPAHTLRAPLVPQPPTQRDAQGPIRPDQEDQGQAIDRLALLAREHPGEPLNHQDSHGAPIDNEIV